MAKKSSRAKSIKPKMVESIEEEVEDIQENEEDFEEETEKDVKIINGTKYILITKPFKLDSNRFHFPAKFTHKCKKCGYEYILDFIKNGLYHPDINQEFTYPIVCKKCNTVKNYTLKFNISLELVENE